MSALFPIGGMRNNRSVLPEIILQQVRTHFTWDKQKKNLPWMTMQVRLHIVIKFETKVSCYHVLSSGQLNFKNVPVQRLAWLSRSQRVQQNVTRNQTSLSRCKNLLLVSPLEVVKKCRVKANRGQRCVCVSWRQQLDADCDRPVSVGAVDPINCVAGMFLLSWQWHARLLSFQNSHPYCVTVGGDMPVRNSSINIVGFLCTGAAGPHPGLLYNFGSVISAYMK